jgi:phage/plasmid primase-like uncharacterized protein
MAEGEQKNSRELCNAAREANDLDEVLKILRELNQALKREGQVRRDFRSRMPGAACIATRWGISITLRSSTALECQSVTAKPGLDTVEVRSSSLLVPTISFIGRENPEILQPA